MKIADVSGRFRVEGAGLDLRELRRDDLRLLNAPGATGTFNQLGPVDPALARADDAERAAIVSKDGTLLGSLSWHIVRHGPNLESRAWSIGINLLPQARGRGVGTEAQRLLADHLLTSTDVDRIEALTDVDNHAEQRALEKAGFRREGVLRGAQFRAGRRHDMTLYSRLRDDP